MTEELMREMNLNADRRDELCNNSPSCPECGSPQVQLMAWVGVVPASWRCRNCKLQFEYEQEEEI